jgi:hypothetical protein
MWVGIRPSCAANASTSESDTPSRRADCALRKSMRGSRRTAPRTIAFRKTGVAVPDGRAHAGFSVHHTFSPLSPLKSTRPTVYPQPTRYHRIRREKMSPISQFANSRAASGALSRGQPEPSPKHKNARTKPLYYSLMSTSAPRQESPPTRPMYTSPVRRIN